MVPVRLAFLLAALSQLLSAASPWQKLGSCLTPNGTPCRTLTYETTRWVNRSWGFHATERSAGIEVEASASNGSTLLHHALWNYKLYVIPFLTFDRARIVLPKQQRTLEIDHTLHEFRTLPGLWWSSELWFDDPDCENLALNAGEVRRKTGAHPVLAGIRAVEYSYESTDHRFAQTIAFAPSLGCTAIAYRYTERNTAGRLVEVSESKLTKAVFGPPDRALFSVPPDYRTENPKAPWTYAPLDMFRGPASPSYRFSMPVE